MCTTHALWQRAQTRERNLWRESKIQGADHGVDPARGPRGLEHRAELVRVEVAHDERPKVAAGKRNVQSWGVLKYMPRLQPFCWWRRCTRKNARATGRSRTEFRDLRPWARRPGNSANLASSLPSARYANMCATAYVTVAAAQCGKMYCDQLSGSWHYYLSTKA